MRKKFVKSKRHEMCSDVSPCFKRVSISSQLKALLYISQFTLLLYFGCMFWNNFKCNNIDRSGEKRYTHTELQEQEIDKYDK